jgi:hypothetical protein
MAARRSFRISSRVVLPTTPVFETYWHFAYERQEVFFRRLSGDSAPWTDDDILRTFRFTNVYRASDRVSQYLIRHVIYEGSQSVDEIFFRIFLFKIFNRIDTWEHLVNGLQQPTWETFDFARYDRLLDDLMRRGERIYSAAYIVPPPDLGRVRKHSNHLLLLMMMMRDKVPDRLATSRTMRESFELLRSYPSLGDFLAFQFAIDLNYGPFMNFSEMDHVVAGPGARSGIRKAFEDTGGFDDEDIIRAVTEQASREFEVRGLLFRSLWGRALQLIDCQNLFCEVDKYSRVAHPEAAGLGRRRIKRRFDGPQTPVDHWYPPKWGLVPTR